MPTGEQFLEFLRGALKHLYDPYFLRRSPLIGLFGLQDQPDAITSLQNILKEAIEKLEPKTGSAYSASAQLVYDLLMYRYVQQFSQEEVASQLGMSVRHLRREQNNATYLLAAALWKDYHLGERALVEPAVEAEPEPAEAEDSGEDSDLAYLRGAGGSEAMQIGTQIASVCELAEPLARRYGVQLVAQALPELPRVIAQVTALRQLLLNLFNLAILRCSAGRVLVGAGILEGMVEVTIESQPARDEPFPANQAEKSNHEMAFRLAEICGARLSFKGEPGVFHAAFSIPTEEQLKVLVIDDNPDNFHLMQHLAMSTRYRLSDTQDPTRAVVLAEELAPDLILLDVMMPRIDGWEVLGRLLRHPRTGHIPVIVCTILPQEEMARALGASGYIRKPITRKNLLTELDLQAQLLEKKPR